MGGTTGGSLQDCAVSCTADATCVSFEYSKEGTSCLRSTTCDVFSLTVNLPDDPMRWYLKHSGDVGAQCFPVVDCIDEASNLPANSFDPDVCYDYCLTYMDLPGFAGYQYSNQKGICECHFDDGQLPPRALLPPGSAVNSGGQGTGPVIGSTNEPAGLASQRRNLQETPETVSM